MAFQNLLNQAGALGRFQIFQVVFYCITLIIVSPHAILENFSTAVPDHRCWVHLLDNDTTSANATGTLSQENLLRVSIPLDSSLRPEKCRRFVHPQWQLLHQNGSFPDVTELDTEPCVDGWVYDHSTFSSTIVTQWDLVCESQSLIPVTKFMFMVGMLVGNCICGHLSDRFGRRFIFRCCLLLLAISDTCVTFAHSLPIYCSLRIISGISVTTIITNTLLLIMEWSVPQFQATGMTLSGSAMNIGITILGGLSFAFQDWHTLQLLLSLPLFVAFLLTRWLAESARWLIVANRPEKGLKELKKIAHYNGIKDAENTLTMEVLRSTMEEELKASQRKPSVFDMFRIPNLRKRICLLAFVKFSCNVSSFGLHFNLQYLGNNISLFQLLFGIVSITGNYLAFFALNHLDRRVSHIVFMFLQGVSILATIYVPQEMQAVRVTLAALGVGISTIIYTCTTVYGNELMPTALRATAVGTSGILGILGGCLAPLLMVLLVYSPSVPWIIYGVFPILGSLVIPFLPETRNKPLPDTIQDVENERKSTKENKTGYFHESHSLREIQEQAIDLRTA